VRPERALAAKVVSGAAGKRVKVELAAARR
jgi:hypothetical protein